MNVYTSDGLLVSEGVDGGTLSAEHGQQLIAIYRLFLQLHHAGTGAMRIKDMIKPDAVDGGGEPGSGSGSGAGGGGGSGSGGPGERGDRRSSALAPEAAATYTTAIPAISAGTPYPTYLLSSRAIPATHRLRGFPSATTTNNTATMSAANNNNNNNRSANGCEELAVRWSLLTKPPPTSPTSSSSVAAAAAAAAAVAAGKSGSGGALGSTATASVKGPAVAPGLLDDDESAGATAAGGVRSATNTTTTTTTTTTAMAAAAAAAHGPPPPPRAPCAYPSGWTAAELQVHTTRRVMVCTATEVPLDGRDHGVEDGSTPLLFCCSTQPPSA
ncbi:hypothetical protein NESM_000591900 [Novymonas esmeraldas]|uniref:Uncharacterized protein n=1 Tax=Novymonas esmeraldas TaxID=1808958 RepID=A0AAW0EQU7_9TRYP